VSSNLHFHWPQGLQPFPKSVHSVGWLSKLESSAWARRLARSLEVATSPVYINYVLGLSIHPYISNVALAISSCHSSSFINSGSNGRLNSFSSNGLMIETRSSLVARESWTYADVDGVKPDHRFFNPNFRIVTTF
jgi:hypothetical protein